MNQSKLTKFCIYAFIFGICALLSVGCGEDDREPVDNTGISDGDGDGDGDSDPGADPTNIAVVTAPPSLAVAGSPFSVSFELVDDGNRRVELEGVEITVTLNRNEFVTGEMTTSAMTDSSGVAEFDLTIEAADTGLVLAATGDHPNLDGITTMTSFFDVVSSIADADASTIFGTDGVVYGDGEAQVTIELIDAYGNHVVGVVPSFAASGEGNAYGDCSETDAQGVATCAMTSTVPGPKTLEITEPVEVTGATIEFFAWDCAEDSSPFGGGNGSSEEPYRICAPEQLNAIGAGTNFLGAHFVVARGVDMDGFENFTIIGDDDNPFAGNFDGGGHSISNLVIESTEDRAGLFGVLHEDGLLSEVVLHNIEISGARFVGGLVGINYGTIIDSHATGGVNGTRDIGGLAGASAGTVEGSSTAGTVHGNLNIGGLIGAIGTDTVISNSYSQSDVTGEDGIVGGLVGRNNGTITDSHASGDVEGNDTSSGGLVGIIDEGAVISTSYATGSVSGTAEVGGLVGKCNGAVNTSHATGDISGTNGVGGLIGLNLAECQIHDSYAIGDVFGATGVGGLVGIDFGELINHCYSTGAVEGDSQVGGFVGGTSVSTITNSYWDEDTSGMDTSSGDSSPLSTSEFAVEANFQDWDFADIWAIGTAPDGEERPILQWQN